MPSQIRPVSAWKHSGRGFFFTEVTRDRRSVAGNQNLRQTKTGKTGTVGNFEIAHCPCLPNQRRKSVQNDVQETLDIAAQFFVHSVKPVHAFGLMDEQFAHLSLRFCDLLKEPIVAPGRSFLRGRKPRQAGDDEVDISLSLFRCHVASNQEGPAGDSNITQCRRRWKASNRATTGQ